MLAAGFGLGTAAVLRADDRPLRPFWSDGEPRVALDAWARTAGLAFRQEEGGGLVLSDGLRTLRLEPDGHRMTFGGVEVWLSSAVRKTGRSWSFHRADAATLADPLVRPALHLPRRPVRVVVLDPGHGGTDGGAAAADGLLEKEVVQDLARRLQPLLAARGFQVHLTRDGDETLALEERTRRAARWKADLFLSLHLNAVEDDVAEGIETYVLSKPGFASTNARNNGDNGGASAAAERGNRHDAANAVLGYTVQRQMVRSGLAVDRGLRQARFMVLRQAPAPAALVEFGFLSHPGEARRLADRAHRQKLVEAVDRAVAEYADQVRWTGLVRGK